MSEFASVCEQAAKIGGKALLELVGQVHAVEKNEHDLVTDADFRSQRLIAEVIGNAFPEHAIVAEEQPSLERQAAPPSEYVWLVDPLDGTTNYVHGFQHFCVSIALVHRREESSELLTATIFDPTRDETFSASAGGGALLNGKPIRASDTQVLGEALLAASLPAVVDPDSVEVSCLVQAMISARSLRRTGSAALNLAYVAAGRLDGYWATSLSPWDAAAGALLVREAGGVITNIEGGLFDVFAPEFVAAATQPLHAQISSVIQTAMTRRTRS